MPFPKTTSADDVLRTFNGVDFEGVFLDFADSNKIEIVKQILKKNFTKVRTVKLGFSKDPRFGELSRIGDRRICLLVPTDEITDDNLGLLDILEK